MTKAWKYVDNVVNKRISANIETITVHLEKLEQAYNDFNEIQRKLVCTIEEDELQTDDQAEDDTFEDRYVELKATLSKWRTSLKPAASASGSSESLAHVLEQQTEVIRALGASAHNENKVKLPTIKLPTFSGEIEDWKRFSDNFATLIHNSELSAVQKHQYLVGALTGSAAKIIESIEISAQNYEVAWNLLKNRYEDPKALKRRHSQCLFEAPKVDRESAVEIEDLVNYFQKHLRILKSMESENESWAESLMLFMIEEKLDGSTRRRWEERMEDRRDVSVCSLFEFLQQRVRMLNRLGSSISKEKSISKGTGPKFGKVNAIESSRSSRRSESRTARNNQSNTPVSLATSTVTGRCFVCNGPHWIYSCEKFLNLSEQERIEEVKRLKLCFNCLKNDHFVSACKASSCRRCSGRHNTLCHTDNERSCAQKSITSNRETVDRKSGQNSSVNLSVHHAVKRANFGQVLMATAVVHVRNSQGFEQPIRVLLDSASEANFITKAACARLNIKTDDIHEAVSGINNAICAINKGCRVAIRSRVTNYQISAFCLVVPKITRELPAISISVKSFSITDTVKLADPQYFHPSQIDILLGNEFFMKLLEPAKIEFGTDLLTLQNTKFGWVISDPIPAQYIRKESVNYVTCMATQTSLHKSLEKFWEIEDCSGRGIITLSSEECACEEIFTETHT